MNFAHPALLVLLALTPVPFLAVLRRSEGLRMTPVGDPKAAAGRARWVWILPLLHSAAIALAVVAAAGPHAASRAVVERRDARDVVLALDTSESMRGVDFRSGEGVRSRLEGAVALASEFIRRRQGDRIGVVAFGGRAITQCPLTFDRDLALWLLAQVQADMLGRRTALGEAIALSVARLSERGGALVVISDGRNTAGEVGPLEAAQLAQSRGVRVYSIAVGAGERVQVPVRLPSGRTVLREKSYPLDEAALRQVAALTGGRFFRASDAGALRGVFAEIDALEPSPVPAVRRLPLGGFGVWLALAAGAALMFLTLGSSLPLRTAPRLR